MLSKKEIKKKNKKGRKTDKPVSTIISRVKTSRVDALNTKLERMTPKSLRSFKGFENIEKQEARYIIETLENFCNIILCQLRSEKEK